MLRLHIVYEDEAVLVLNKPAGLLSVPGRGANKYDSLASRVQQKYPDACIVHRLDMATSGLIVMARGKNAQRILSMAFAERQVEKTYLAKVAGCPSTFCGEINLPLQADWPYRPRQKIDEVSGKPSLTYWSIAKKYPHSSHALLQLKPSTGRTHQLRVHLAAIGHPILGDTLYAPPEFAFTFPRLMLQANTLTFSHPFKLKTLKFTLSPEF